MRQVLVLKNWIKLVLQHTCQFREKGHGKCKYKYINTTQFRNQLITLIKLRVSIVHDGLANAN
jgi:hypothetical protein